MRSHLGVVMIVAVIAVLTFLPQQQASAQAPQRKSPYIGTPVMAGR